MEYTWRVSDLRRRLDTGLVYEVYYTYTAEHNGYVEDILESIYISGSADDPNFISYLNLEESNVLGWITGSIDSGSLQSQLSSSINERIAAYNSITASMGTPWL